MKKATILILMILAIMTIYKAVSVPEWVKVNAEMVQACTMDMQANANIICD